ncbi:MAG: NADH-quinone oxidoreductase subunit N [Candidatus Diapherotrites archaeon]|nr:NADH-quinone oxidoreductase subunit N [Candidatus Diapherotrites archaeon]
MIISEILAIALVLAGVACYAIVKFGGKKFWPFAGLLATLALCSTFLLFAYFLLSGNMPEGTDGLSILLGFVSSGLGAAAALYSIGAIKEDTHLAYFYPLFLISVAGTMAIGFAGDLFTVFVMVEFASIPSYFLVAYNLKKEKKVLSAIIKYLVQGTAGTLSALLGLSMVFLVTGTLNIAAISGSALSPSPILVIALCLVVAGYGVKLGLVPLHTWLPGAYYYSVPSVTVLLASITKIGFFMALARTLLAFPQSILPSAHLGLVLCIFAILTMTFGNFLALVQKDLKRMLAYSSIAQMGYAIAGLSIAFEYNSAFGLAAALFYIVAYSIMKGGAFFCAGAFESLGIKDIADLKGIAKSKPLLAACFSVFILSLIGIPFTLGFPGKLFLLGAGIAQFGGTGLLLVLIMILNVAVSLGYYVPVISAMFSEDGNKFKQEESHIGLAQYAAILSLVIATVVIGFYPVPAFGIVKAAAWALMG